MLEPVHKAFHAVLQPLKGVSLSCHVRVVLGFVLEIIYCLGFIFKIFKNRFKLHTAAAIHPKSGLVKPE